MKIEQLEPFGTRISGLSVDKLLNTSVLSFEEILKRQGFLLIDNIFLKPDELKQFCEKFSKVESTDLAKSENGIDGVLRVSSQKGKDGEPLGIFGHDSFLGWHANRPSSKDRKSIVCTYSKEGCDGSQTWWSSPQLLFSKLSDCEKQQLRGVKAYFGFKEGSYTEEKYKAHKNQVAWPIVFERFDEENFYFPFNQIVEFEPGLSEDTLALIEKLKLEVVKEEFSVKHVWKGNQIILSDQWSTIHCRPVCKMEGRTILRVTFNYHDDVFPF